MKTILTVLLPMFIAYASPPNFWDFGFGQGWAEYGISSKNKINVSISCNVGVDDTTDHSVRIYHEGYDFIHNKEINGDVTFIINDSVYYVPNRGVHGLSTATRGGGMSWDNTMTALASATKFDLYINDKFVARFTPSKANLKGVFGNERTFCESLFLKTLGD